ncbi:MAG TPA: YcxB family protein [Lysobacter sp.]
MTIIRGVCDKVGAGNLGGTGQAMEASTPRAIELVCTLTLIERVRASVLLIWQRWLSVAFAAVWVIAGVSLIVLYWHKEVPITPAIWMVAVACALFAPSMAIIGAISAHFNKRNRERFTYTFNDIGIHVSADSYEYTHKWVAISRVKRLGGFLMIFFSPGCAHCMPLHAVHAAEAFEPLLKLAAEHGVPTDDA